MNAAKKALPSRFSKPSAARHSTSSSTYGNDLGLLSSGNEVGLGRPGSASYQKLSENVTRSMLGKGKREVSARKVPHVSANDAITANHPAFLQLKEQLASRGAVGIVGLSRAFKRMDIDGSKALNFGEFSQALSDSGIKMAAPQQRQLFVFFDRDRTGSVDYNEFLTGLRVSSVCIVSSF
jgi:Ca2+-binding EF-hand superfamily protein